MVRRHLHEQAFEGTGSFNSNLKLVLAKFNEITNET